MSIGNSTRLAHDGYTAHDPNTAHDSNTALDGDTPLDLDVARQHIASAALRPEPVGPVGLELEYHVVDRGHPERRVSYAELTALISGLPALPHASAVTIEPGGQLELSGPPLPLNDAITNLQRDEALVANSFAAAGFGLAPIGADPARQPVRITPVARYAAMERHFDAVGCGEPGRQMMTATAALQINLNAGPSETRAARLRHVHSLGPVLSAISACSPYLAGRASGWRSMRSQVWGAVDPARTRPVDDDTDPGQAWADYALAAPVMLIRSADGTDAESVTRRVSFADWLSGEATLSRPATLEDLAYHLSTLFPPVRLRGYLEVRYLDAVPRAWWPALTAIVATLIDDPVAADLAADAVSGTEQAWTVAARDGLGHRDLRRAAQACLEIAASRCPPEQRPGVERYRDLVRRGRTPGDRVRDTVTARGAIAALIEATDA